MEPTGNLQSEEIATTEVGAIESQKNYVPKISKEELYKTFEHISTRETRRNEEYGYSYVFAHKNWSPFHSEEEYTTADISLSMYEAGWRKALDGWDETRKTIWTHGGNEMIIFDFDFDNADAMQYMKFDSPEKLLIYLEDNSLKNFVVKNPDENNLTKLRRFVLDKCRERLPFAE